MPEVYDYGDANSKALVPGSLTVFRHFGADLASGTLAPMNRRHHLMADPDSPGNRAYPPEPGEVYGAECSKPYGAWYHSAGLAQPTDHPAPRVDCSCGFYAHYDPMTDFYPSSRWGDTYSLTTGDRRYCDKVMVRAVVEMTGTVVMGRLGVRAEKMQIKAIAIDWSKRLQTPVSPYGPGGVIEDVYDLTGIGYRSYRAEPDGDAEIIDEVATIADRYGVEFWGSSAEMYAAHPKADVEALGVDTTPRRRADDSLYHSGGVVSPTLSDQQAQAYAKAATQAATSFALIRKKVIEAYGFAAKGIQGATVTLAIYDEALNTPQSAFERALEAKKSRPAAPGSGIDRRKRKL